MAKYGLPYQGSKSKIADELCKIFPSADNFYDLFGGGFSITHCMLTNRSNDFNKFHFNEIRPGICELVVKAISGEYSYENFKPKWVTREEFFAKKDLDPYIKLCWSFGNGGRSYIFGKNIEEYKRSLHNAVVFNDFNDLAKSVLGIDSFDGIPSIKERRLLVRKIVKLRYPDLPEGDLKRLQQLEWLERLERLELTSVSYEQVPIAKNSIIYCDIPYKATKGYDNTFDRVSFLDWVSAQSEPVFISEYDIDDARFTEVFSVGKRSLMAPDKSNTIIKQEKVYVNAAALKKLRGLK